LSCRFTTGNIFSNQQKSPGKEANHYASLEKKKVGITQ